MPLGVYSEVGQLRRVMVHRPGLEHSRLTPSNAGELLFDDVIWVARAKAEHDMFVEVMRGRGVEVFLAERLLAEALDQPGVRDWVAGHILNEREVGITAATHHLDEHVVLSLSPCHPDHVIEQQLLRIRRRQAAMLQARPVHHDPAQLAYLGIDSQWHGDLLALRTA